MERDFMGLKDKDCPDVVVREEEVEESKGSASGSNPGFPWSLQSKHSAVPHFTSVKTEQDEKPSRMMFDAGASHGHMNFAGACVEQQSVSGNLVAAPYAAHRSFSPVAGETAPRIYPKAAEVLTQLTIFYDGTVNVFDGISPEKVQAIMIWAARIARAKTDVQMPVSVPGSGEPIHISADRALANQPMGMPVDQSAVAAANEDIKVTNTISMSANLAHKGEPPLMVTSSGPVASTPMLPAAVPQARKASLASFLEKRKERAMKAAPYNPSKKAGNSVTPESNGNEFSATSGVSSCSTSSSKDINA